MEMNDSYDDDSSDDDSEDSYDELLQWYIAAMVVYKLRRRQLQRMHELSNQVITTYRIRARRPVESISLELDGHVKGVEAPSLHAAPNADGPNKKRRTVIPTNDNETGDTIERQSIQAIPNISTGSTIQNANNIGDEVKMLQEEISNLKKEALSRDVSDDAKALIKQRTAVLEGNVETLQATLHEKK